MKKGMYTGEGETIFTDSQVAALRMSIASICLFPFAFKAFKRIKSAKTWLSLAIVGCCGNFFPAFLFTFAETGISSGYTGMLNSFTPIFAIIIGTLIFKEKLSSKQFIGVIIGTIGIIGLSLAGNNSSYVHSIYHVGAVILATLFYAISLNTIKYMLKGLPSKDVTSLAFFTISIPALILSYTTGSFETITTNQHAMSGLLFISILSIIGTAFAVLLFTELISISSVIFSSSVTYLIPIVAVIIGFWFKESITTLQIFSMLVILLGVFIANANARKINLTFAKKQ